MTNRERQELPETALTVPELHYGAGIETLQAFGISKEPNEVIEWLLRSNNCDVDQVIEVLLRFQEMGPGAASNAMEEYRKYCRFLKAKLQLVSLPVRVEYD